MFPKMDERAVKAAMKKMGMQQQDIVASEVMIKCPDKTIVIENPQVSRIVMMGQEMFQVTGKAIEKSPQPEISEEDARIVMEKTGASEEKAVAALKKSNGDIAEAIMGLS